MELLFMDIRRELEANGEGGIMGVCFGKNLEQWAEGIKVIARGW